MKQILFTKTFEKLLYKLWSISKDDIINLIKKYPNTNNLEKIDDIDFQTFVIKGYLLSKKVRILILFQNVKSKFIPVSIVKKESKDWWNITKENYIEIFWNHIDKSIIDIDNNDYEIIEI